MQTVSTANTRPATQGKSGAAPKKAARKLEANHWASLFVLSVMVVLLALSITHLGHGLAQLTGDSVTLSWCLAIAIDIGLLGSETALIVASLKRISGVKGWAWTTLSTTLVLSATLNSLSYTHYEPTGALKFGLCVFLGCFVPSMVFCLGKTAYGLAVGLKVKTEDSGEIRELRLFLAQRRKHKTNAACAAALEIDPATVTRKLQRCRELGLIS